MNQQFQLAGLESPAASRPLTKSNVSALHRAHSGLRDADGLHADKALDELCKLLFAKLWDELKNPDNPCFVEAEAIDSSMSAKIHQLYVDARDHAFGTGGYANAVGAFSEPIQLSQQALCRVVGALAPLSLLNSSADIKGAAFQQVLSAAIRSGMGQYFTPEPVVDCIVQMIAPEPVDIIDWIPPEYADQGVGFVSELLLLRFDPLQCDPYVLLMWLRSPEGYAALQSCVVGQTGHLYAEAAEKIRVPKAVLNPTAEMLKAMVILKRALKYRRVYRLTDAKASCTFNAALTQLP